MQATIDFELCAIVAYGQSSCERCSNYQKGMQNAEK